MQTAAAAAAAKSLQSCPTLCDPIDVSPRGSPVPGILQERTLEWVAISFSNAGKWKVRVKLLSRVRLLATPWTAATRLLRLWDFPGKSTGVGCHCLLHNICIGYLITNIPPQHGTCVTIHKPSLALFFYSFCQSEFCQLTFNVIIDTVYLYPLFCYLFSICFTSFLYSLSSYWIPLFSIPSKFLKWLFNQFYMHSLKSSVYLELMLYYFIWYTISILQILHTIILTSPIFCDNHFYTFLLSYFFHWLIN